MLIYVVEGSTGEYSDHTEWLVKAYKDESKAKAHVVRATEVANKLFQSRESKFSEGENETNPYDPDMRMDYTGVHYTYFSVELEE
jgi:hypothetical protein